MLTGPKIRLAVDLHRIDRFFPLDFNLTEGFNFDMIIDRQRFDEVAAILSGFGVSDDKVNREICFILLWIGRETQAGGEKGNLTGQFSQMWIELDALKDFLMKARITTISFIGEYGRNLPGEELIIREDINIDRICDGIRTVFREEFDNDKSRRKTKGLTAWQSRKMIRIRNNFLNYFTAIPSLDLLSLEEQNELIDKITGLVNI